MSHVAGRQEARTLIDAILAGPAAAQHGARRALNGRRPDL